MAEAEAGAGAEAAVGQESVFRKRSERFIRDLQALLSVHTTHPWRACVGSALAVEEELYSKVCADQGVERVWDTLAAVRAYIQGTRDVLSAVRALAKREREQKQKQLREQGGGGEGLEEGQEQPEAEVDEHGVPRPLTGLAMANAVIHAGLGKRQATNVFDDRAKLLKALKSKGRKPNKRPRNDGKAAAAAGTQAAAATEASGGEGSAKKFPRLATSVRSSSSTATSAGGVSNGRKKRTPTPPVAPAAAAAAAAAAAPPVGAVFRVAGPGAPTPAQTTAVAGGASATSSLTQSASDAEGAGAELLGTTDSTGLAAIPVEDLIRQPSFGGNALTPRHHTVVPFMSVPANNSGKDGLPGTGDASATEIDIPDPLSLLRGVSAPEPASASRTMDEWQEARDRHQTKVEAEQQTRLQIQQQRQALEDHRTQVIQQQQQQQLQQNSQDTEDTQDTVVSALDGSQDADTEREAIREQLQEDTQHVRGGQRPDNEDVLAELFQI